MKNFLAKFSAIVIAVVMVVSFVSSCSVEDLTKDLTIYTGNTFLVNPISVQIGDAAHLENVPNDLTITVEGRDKAKIFSLVGKAKLQAVNGILALAVKSVDAPTPTNPLEFTLVLSATNYVTVHKNYVVTRGDMLSTDQIAMVNLVDAPEGVSVQNTSFANTVSGLTESIAFNSPLSGGKDEQTSVKINAGTQTLAADGSVLSGTIRAQLVHYDAHSEASLSGIPEGFGNLTLKTPTTTRKIAMNPAGFYSLSMSADGKEVSKFSQPLDVTMDIDPDFYSNVHGRKIQAGDQLDVISRKENETVWTAETKTTVVNINGKLKVQIKQPHLSFWIPGEFIITNDVVYNTQLKINSDLPTSVADCAARAAYYYKVVNANNMNIVYKSGLSYFSNGEVLDDDVKSVNNIDIRFVISNAANVVVYTSPRQNLVNNPSINLIGKLPINKSVVGNVNVSGVCTSSTGINTVLVPHNAIIWFRNMKTPANAPFGGWTPLVNILNGKGCARGLVAGESYDFVLPIGATEFSEQAFQQTFSKCLKQPNGLKIPESGDLVVTVKSPVYKLDQTFTVQKKQDGIYEVIYERYPLPANICDEIDKNFSIFIRKTKIE
jgi:hypothetical protein